MKRTKKTMAMAAVLMLAGSLVGCREERIATDYGAIMVEPDSDITVGDTIKDETDGNKDEIDNSNKEDTDNNKEDTDNGENKLEVSTSDEISDIEDNIVQMKYGVYMDKLGN